VSQKNKTNISLGSLILVGGMFALMQFPLISCMLEFDRDKILAGEWWRLWSGHVVHYSWQHMLVNVAAIFLLTAIMEKLFSWKRIIALLILAAPVISIGLLIFNPHLYVYRGASSLVTFLIALVACLIWEKEKRIFSLLAISLLALKIISEAIHLKQDWSGMPLGIEVTWQAHALGFCLALLAVLLNYLLALVNIKRNKSPA
jgi:rhomboid family GlyGly-CTERM serine protease